MPPPVEPVLHKMQDKNNIHTGAKIGQRSQFSVAKPVVEATDTTANVAWRKDVPKLAYEPFQVKSPAMNTMLIASIATIALASGSSL